MLPTIAQKRGVVNRGRDAGAGKNMELQLNSVIASLPSAPELQLDCGLEILRRAFNQRVKELEDENTLVRDTGKSRMTQAQVLEQKVARMEKSIEDMSHQAKDLALEHQTLTNERDLLANQYKKISHNVKALLAFKKNCNAFLQHKDDFDVDHIHDSLPEHVRALIQPTPSATPAESEASKQLEDAPPPRGGVWVFYEDLDMADQGDVDVIENWEDHYSVEELKQVVEDQGYSAFVLKEGTAYIKNFEFQLTEDHCQPTDYPCVIHIFAPRAPKSGGSARSGGSRARSGGSRAPSGGSSKGSRGRSSQNLQRIAGALDDDLEKLKEENPGRSPRWYRDQAGLARSEEERSEGSHRDSSEAESHRSSHADEKPWYKVDGEQRDGKTRPTKSANSNRSRESHRSGGSNRSGGSKRREEEEEQHWYQVDGKRQGGEGSSRGSNGVNGDKPDRKGRRIAAPVAAVRVGAAAEVARRKGGHVDDGAEEEAENEGAE